MYASVLIPTFRRPAKLSRVVESVLAQLREGDEVVVVDDGSGDETGAVLKAIGDVRLTVIQQANAGVSAARNRAIEVARNELLVFLDDDELPEQGWLEAHRRAHSGARRVAAMGRAALVVPHRRGTQVIPPDPRARPTELINDSFSVRRADLLAVGGFDARFVHGGEDVDLGLRLRAAGVDLVVADGAVIRHEINRSYREFRRQRLQRGRASALFAQVHGVRLQPDVGSLNAVDRLLAGIALRSRALTEVAALVFWGVLRAGGLAGSWPIQKAAAGRAAVLLGYRGEAHARAAGQTSDGS